MNTALVCIAKNEDDYIEEWINYHIKLGFDKIFIYANDWDYSSNNDKVCILNINGEIQQVNAYNSFLNWHNKTNEYNWAAFFDIDEFLVLNKHNNVKDLLKEYEECNAIGINWAIFGNNYHKHKKSNLSVLKRFTRRAAESFDVNKHIKTIVKLPCNKKMRVHELANGWFNLNKEKKDGAFNQPVDWSIAQLNHYFTKSEQELEIKCNRGRADNKTKRKKEDYYAYLNANDIEDTKACHFLYGDNLMKHYKDISGWFEYTQTYDFLLNSIPDNGIFVECGAWLGRSSAYLCEQAKSRINVYIVDSWKGSANELNSHHKLATETDIFQIFTDNMRGYQYTPIRSLSQDAVNHFEDESCDVVFIDMEHTYEAVKNDINIWINKVKNGGYLAGHDYVQGWPGVVAAVNESFGEENIIKKDDCWIFKKS